MRDWSPHHVIGTPRRHSARTHHRLYCGAVLRYRCVEVVRVRTRAQLTRVITNWAGTIFMLGPSY